MRPFNAPVLIYRYDLQTHTETQVSPAPQFFAGRAHPGKDIEWTSNIPVMDLGPFFMPNGRIGFTTNRDSGFYRFQLFAMDGDGKNLSSLGSRAMNQQLHPAILKDGRTVYTSFDVMLQKEANNQYSLFTINPDGSFPFILVGKHDATGVSYHFTTQLSDGDVVVTRYYNHNNGGMGTLLRFPIDPPGADFENLKPDDGVWRMGNDLTRFTRVGEYELTPQASAGDSVEKPYEDPNDYWTHPSRTGEGRTLTINGIKYIVDTNIIRMHGRYTHPAAAPDNDLLVTYTIGESSTMGGYDVLSDMLQRSGKDAGIWLLPLEPRSKRQVEHIADDGRIVVDFPQYHEIMPRAVVPYSRIYNIPEPGIDETNGQPTPFVKEHDNLGLSDGRLNVAGAPYGLSGASSLYDRETRSPNGVPWNMRDGGGQMSGRTYTNLGSSGAELAIYDNDEIYGIRVLLPIPGIPNGYGPSLEGWAGHQKHHTRVLGEFPVRKADGSLVDLQGNPDTSFMVKIPADTPFLFQTLDKRGMALDIETTSRSVVRGEQQMCIGCHVHTREGMDPFQSQAKRDVTLFGDFSGESAPLFAGNDANGQPIVAKANAIYSDSLAPGVNDRRSFAVDWQNGVANVIQTRCSGCHAPGARADNDPLNGYGITGLRLDGDERTYDLLTTNSYTREDGKPIDANTMPGDGLNDVRNNTPNTDRITERFSCCTASRWISFNSARSSMLVWALYGERLDGRNPATGLSWGAAGEAIPASVAKGLRNVPVDNDQREHPEIWPKVAEHAAYLTSMSEAEKRLIARWIDIGAPKSNVHDDMVRPVITITPVREGETIKQVLIGLWDDSKLDYNSFKVSVNGTAVLPSFQDGDDVITVNLPVAVSAANADSQTVSVEITDKPNRAFSVKLPGTAAVNRSRKIVTGRGLLRMADATPNAAPTATSATIVTVQNTPSPGVIPSVTDPDVGDTHLFTVLSQPQHGNAAVVNNRLVYTPQSGYLGNDSFTYKASDLGGKSVNGTAAVTVNEPTANSTPPTGSPSSPTRGSNSAQAASSGGGGTWDWVGLTLLSWIFWRRRLCVQL